MSTSPDLHALLGDDADALLGYTAKAFPAENLVLPGSDYLSRVFTDSDRSPTVLRNLGRLFNHGRLGGTATSPSSRSTRGSSTRPRRASRRTPPTSIR